MKEDWILNFFQNFSDLIVNVTSDNKAVWDDWNMTYKYKS